MFKNRAYISLAYFQLYTLKDKELKYNNNDFIRKYIEKFLKKKISTGVITNHNKFDKGEFKDLRREAYYVHKRVKSFKLQRI